MRRSLAKLGRRFPGKRAFITGSANGLGLSLARMLARDGWSLGLFDMNTATLAAAEGELASVAHTVQAYPGDVTHADELTVAVNSFAASVGGLDLMINNAAVASGGAFQEHSAEDWRWLMEINVLGVVQGCRAALPHLQHGGHGLFINVASAAAFLPFPRMCAYSASKAAVMSLSESLGAELRDSGIDVAVAMPGFFESALLEGARIPDSSRDDARLLLTRSGYTADDAARDILASAADGHLFIVVPARIRGLWHWKRLLPKQFRAFFPAVCRRWLADLRRRNEQARQDR